jgi:dinuclear metal center YbgI/SA1388 family protein
MICKDLMCALEELASPEYALSWDNVGLLVGGSEREIHKIYLALDADGTAVDTAISQGCDMIITHHPLIFSGIKSIREEDFLGKRLLKIAEHKINYYAMHTNFDVAVMADLVADRMGLNVLSPLEVTCEENGILKGIGSVGTMNASMTLKELAAHIKNVFSLPQVRFYGNPDRIVDKVAVCPGSGKGMEHEALGAGAQVLITGDIDHHSGLDSLEKGLCIIDAGHHGLEHVFVDYMKQWLSEHFEQIEVVTDRNVSPFHVI